jgi:hypothetical protein
VEPRHDGRILGFPGSAGDLEFSASFSAVGGISLAVDVLMSAGGRRTPGDHEAAIRQLRYSG